MYVSPDNYAGDVPYPRMKRGVRQGLHFRRIRGPVSSMSPVCLHVQLILRILLVVARSGNQ